ncbi:MAG: methyltransferase domain-containing protein [Pseudolysinimonas sp.]
MSAAEVDFATVTARYDEIAEQYDSIYLEEHFLREEEIVADVLARVARPRDRVLDLGCGTGKALELLPEHRSYAGIDVSRAMLAEAHRKFPGTDFFVAGAEDLPFADDSFDLVVSTFGSLSHVHDIPQAVDEMARVLTPAGRFCVMLYGLNSTESRGRSSTEIVEYIPRALAAPAGYSIPAWLYSRNDAAQIFRRRFSSVRVRSLSSLSNESQNDRGGRVESAARRLASLAFPNRAHSIIVTGRVARPRRMPY